MVPMNIRDPFFKDPFFSSTWEEFDKMRQDMISSSKDFWGKVDKDFANFDEQVKKSHADMDRSMAVFRPQLPRWAVSGGADLMPPMTHPTLGRQFSTGLATNSIFYVSFLYKIIDLPGGQINEPSSGKDFSLTFLRTTPLSLSETLEGIF